MVANECVEGKFRALHCGFALSRPSYSRKKKSSWEGIKKRINTTQCIIYSSSHLKQTFYLNKPENNIVQKV